MSIWPRRRHSFAVRAMLAAGVLFAIAWISSGESGEDVNWTVAGRNLGNSRSQPAERTIPPENVSSLVTKWVFATGASVSATPTVAGNAIYVPDWCPTKVI